MLRATRGAGHPGSHFHVPDLAAWRSEYGLPVDAPLRDILAAGHARGRGRDDRFGLRLQRRSATFLFEQLRNQHPKAPSDCAAFEAEFGPTRWIYLWREDVVAQAVSVEIARQSGLWHRAPDGTEIERLSPPAAPVYDRAALAAHIAEFVAAQAAWRDWFTAQAIAPLEVTYRALSDAPHQELNNVLGHLGQSKAPEISLPTARLADEVNAEWIARYRKGA